jgi:hypothetical protein
MMISSSIHFPANEKISTLHCICIPYPPLLHPHQHLLFIFLITGLRWNHSVVLVCIFFVAKVVEHFFMYLLAICTSFENCVQFILPFINWIFFCWSLNFGCLYIFWILILYLMKSWQRFSPIL